MWNVTSMVNKTPDIMEHILDRDSSIVFLSETWLISNKNYVTALVKTYGYVLVHRIRKDRLKEIGGGVGILLKSNIEHKSISHGHFSSFEHIIIKASFKSKKLLLISIYRILFVSITAFLDEISTLLEVLVTMKEDFIITGDVNIHLDEKNIYSLRFKELLDSFGVIQHVSFPTHVQGHTLDMIGTYGNTPLVQNVTSQQYDISHHF